MKKIVCLFFCLFVGTANASLIYSDTSIASNLRNISGTGTQFSLGDDSLTGNIALGFNFNFYDVIQNSVRVSSNGFLHFGTDNDNGCCSGDPIPSTFTPNGIFAGLWEDLDSNNNTTGTMYHQTLGAIGSQEFVVGFYNVAHWPNGNPVTFEMILHEVTNNLEVQFGNLSGEGGTHSIGIENYDGTQGLEFYRGSNIAQFSNTGVLFEASANSVPEPATLALFGIGLAGMGFARRRKSA